MIDMSNTGHLYEQNIHIWYLKIFFFNEFQMKAEQKQKVNVHRNLPMKQIF